MGQLSVTPVERARKAFARVLRSMRHDGTQRNLAQTLGVSETTVSRIKTEHLEDAIALLYQIGFKVVAQDRQCVPEDYLRALQVMAREHIKAGPPLQWEDEDE